ncbi:hypothetical protein B0T19DRAFT_421618 [Cercophora scortea]|uniref:Uncharacterized protein n=1 Tax=Cercophora scortea TaxID=314031 RepID=A0AAE0ILQ9_9PEZI|nr:hypothetical protein B0T19DRAFT_421618 [Cercophora scortea]
MLSAGCRLGEGGGAGVLSVGRGDGGGARVLLLQRLNAETNRAMVPSWPVDGGQGILVVTVAHVGVVKVAEVAQRLAVGLVVSVVVDVYFGYIVLIVLVVFVLVLVLLVVASFFSFFGIESEVLAAVLVNFQGRVDRVPLVVPFLFRKLGGVEDRVHRALFESFEVGASGIGGYMETRGGLEGGFRFDRTIETRGMVCLADQGENLLAVRPGMCCAR